MKERIEENEKYLDNIEDTLKGIAETIEKIEKIRN